MVDPGESVSVTLKREFGEEAMNSLQATAKEKARMEKTLSKLFSSGKEVRELACVNVTPATYLMVCAFDCTDLQWIRGRPAQYGQRMDGNSCHEFPRRHRYGHIMGERKVIKIEMVSC